MVGGAGGSVKFVTIKYGTQLHAGNH
jgi:hypothetical protein